MNNSIGIDVSKGKSTIAVMRPFGEVVIPPFDCAHTESKLEELAKSFDPHNNYNRYRDIGNAVKKVPRNKSWVLHDCKWPSTQWRETPRLL